MKVRNFYFQKHEIHVFTITINTTSMSTTASASITATTFIIASIATLSFLLPPRLSLLPLPPLSLSSLHHYCHSGCLCYIAWHFHHYCCHYYHCHQYHSTIAMFWCHHHYHCFHHWCHDCHCFHHTIIANIVTFVIL